MSRWTHLICDECWHKESENDEELPIDPVRVRDAAPGDCCFCGTRTSSGIYLRRDPETVKCGGSHA